MNVRLEREQDLKSWIFGFFCLLVAFTCLLLLGRWWRGYCAHSDERYLDIYLAGAEEQFGMISARDLGHSRVWKVSFDG